MTQLLKLYFLNLLIAIDQLGNTLLGGDPDETISSRAAKNQRKKHWRILGYILEWLDPGHLRKSFKADEGSKGLAYLWRRL